MPRQCELGFPLSSDDMDPWVRSVIIDVVLLRWLIERLEVETVAQVRTGYTMVVLSYREAYKTESQSW